MVLVPKAIHPLGPVVLLLERVFETPISYLPGSLSRKFLAFEQKFSLSVMDDEEQNDKLLEKDTQVFVLSPMFIDSFTKRFLISLPIP